MSHPTRADLFCHSFSEKNLILRSCPLLTDPGSPLFAAHASKKSGFNNKMCYFFHFLSEGKYKYNIFKSLKQIKMINVLTNVELNTKVNRFFRFSTGGATWSLFRAALGGGDFVTPK